MTDDQFNFLLRLIEERFTESERRTRALIEESEQRTRALIQALIKESESRTRALIEDLGRKVQALSEAITASTASLDTHEQRFTGVEGRVDQTGMRLDIAERRIGQVEANQSARRKPRATRRRPPIPRR